MKWSIRLYLTLGLCVPPIMYAGGLLFFIPRNPSYYVQGGYLNWTNLSFSALTWVALAWAVFLLGVWFDHPKSVGKEAPGPGEHVQGSLDSETLPGGGIRAYLSRPMRPIYGWKAVVVYFAICFFIFAYFEVQYRGYRLLGPWELAYYLIVLVPFFTLTYLGRRWLPSWRIYVIVWILWGIIWDTSVPGFVYVPNFFTWHQWVFSAAAARFVVDGYL